MNTNIKKSIIITIALFSVVSLILLSYYFMPKIGTSQTSMSDTISAMWNMTKLTNNLGKSYTLSYNTYASRTDIYCTKYGRAFWGDNTYKVAAKYTIKNTDLSFKKGSDYHSNYKAISSSDNGYKLSMAMMYIMATETKENSSHSGYEYTKYQEAMWRIMTKYGFYKTGYVIDSSTSGKLATKATQAAEYMYRVKTYGYPKKISTTVKCSTKTISGTQYYVFGPYKVQYQQSGDFGKIKGTYQLNEHVQVCNDKGTPQDISTIKANQESTFYVRMTKAYYDKNCAQKEKGYTFKLKFNKLNLSGSFIDLYPIDNSDQPLVTGTGEFSESEQELVFDIPLNITTDYKVEKKVSGDFTLNLKKVDGSGNALQGATFKCTLAEKYDDETGKTHIYDKEKNENELIEGNYDEFYATSDENGNISFPKIYLNNVYDKLKNNFSANGKTFSQCVIIIEEVESATGYIKSEGKVATYLNLSKELISSTSKETWNGNQKIVTSTEEYEIKVASIRVDNYSNITIMCGNDRIENYYNVDDDYIYENVGGYAEFTLTIPNTKTDYPDYQVLLNKLDFDSGNELEGAKFKLEIEDDHGNKVSGYSTKWEFVCSNGTLLQDRIIIDNNITSETDQNLLNEIQNGYLTINGRWIHLGNIRYEGTLLLHLTEIEAPEGYGVINDTITIALTIENKQITKIQNNIDGDITYEFINAQSIAEERTINQIKETEKASIVKGTDSSTESITIKDKRAYTGNDSILIQKYAVDYKEDKSAYNNSEIGANNRLAGVEFKVYGVEENADGQEIQKELATLLTSGSRDAELLFEANYQFDEADLENAIIDQGLNDVKFVNRNKYIIKETKTADGYINSNGQVYVEMLGVLPPNTSEIQTGCIYVRNEGEIPIFIEVPDLVSSNNFSSRIVKLNSGKSVAIYSSYSMDVSMVDKYYEDVSIYANYTADYGIPTSELIFKFLNPKVNTGSYGLNVKKVNSNNGEVTVTGAKFAVYDADTYKLGLSGDSTEQNVPVCESNATNEVGEATLNIPLNKAGTYTYYIKEIQAGNGYQLLSEDEYIQLTLEVQYDETTNTFVVANATIRNKLIDTQFNGNRRIKVNDTEIYSPSEEGATQENTSITVGNNPSIVIEIPNDPVIKTGEYSIAIQKVDSKTNEAITGARFKINEDTFATNSEGKIENTFTISESDWSTGAKKYSITEAEAPEGYIKLNGNIDVEVSFTSANNENGETVYAVEYMTITNNTDTSITVSGTEIQPYTSQTLKNADIVINIPNESETYIDLALKKFIVGVTDNNGTYTETQGREPIYDTASLATSTEATYTFDKTNPVEVAQGNIVKYTIRIYNEGSSDGYASLIRDYLPNGVELAENSTINTNYGWTTGDDGNGRYISTTYLKDTMIGKYDGGITLDYEDVQVELKVTMSDMYIGTLKNVAEIAEMKDEDGNVITKDVDSSTEGTSVTRDGDTIADYSPKEDDIDYDWIKLKDGIPFAGKVWLDVPEENTKDTENGLVDNHESFDKIKENGGVTAEIYKIKDSEMTKVAETSVKDDGTYEFVDIKKSDDGINYNKYIILFKYNGINYTNTLYKVGIDYKVNSKAQEDTSERTTFNNKFATINNQSGITYTSISDDKSKKITSKYNFDENMVMTAKTEIISLNINTNTDELKYFNLGLKQRPTFDMALYKDVDHATVTVNGQTETYTYDKYASYNPTTEEFDAFSYNVRKSDYNLNVRRIDRDTQKSTGLKINVTYIIKLTNQSSTYGNVSKIVDYYDSNYSFVSAEVKDKDENVLDVGLKVDATDVSTPPEYMCQGNYHKKMNITMDKNANSILDNNESLYLYVTFQFINPELALQKLNNGESLKTMNFAEIAEYSTFTSDDPQSTTPGVIDIDSAPENFDMTKYKDSESFMEDDAGNAPAFTYVDDKSGRLLTGNVFEDIGDNSDNANNINIKDIKVELIEIDNSGNPILENGSYRSLTYKTTTTDENGNYKFEDFLPGKYIIRFGYGDSYQTVLTTANGGSNEKSYNGQDYASTDYNVENYQNNDYWYKTVTDKSDATDNASRRQTVNEYSQNYTNYIAEVLNSWKANPINEDKVNELIAETNMFADTANMILSVENRDNNNNIVYKDENGKNTIVYNVTGIDFGLKKRPTNEVTIKKQVSKVTVLSSSGETLASASMDNTHNVLWVKDGEQDGFVKVELEDALINGATLQIEYKVSLENTGNLTTQVTGIVDYVDNNLRFDAETNPEWEVVTAEELQKEPGSEDEERAIVNNSIDLSKRQVILQASDNNPLLNTDIEAKTTFEETATLTLTKTLTTSNSAEDDLSYENIIEIVGTYNEEGRKTEESTPGNLIPDPDENSNPLADEPGDDSAEIVTISNPTGQTQIYYVLGITIGIILIAGIVLIKKIVISKKD